MAVENINTVVPSGTQEIQTEHETRQVLQESVHDEADKTVKESNSMSDNISLAISDAVARLNKELGRDIHIEVSGKSDPVVVKVFESESGKLIRQIPAEHILEISKRVEHLSGILFNEEV